MGQETVLGMQALCSDAGKAWSPMAPCSFLTNLSTTLGLKQVKPWCSQGSVTGVFHSVQPTLTPDSWLL